LQVTEVRLLQKKTR